MLKEINLYALTTVSFEVEDGELPRIRTVGVYEASEAATKTLEKNMGDLNEAGYYPHAVIEQIETGLYPVPKQHSVWEFTGGQWQQCPEYPADVKAYLSKAIGFCSIG